MLRPIALLSACLFVVSTPCVRAQVQPVPTPDITPVQPKPVAKTKTTKGYSGPTEVIELPATPALDQDGRPMLDPAGKPVLNPPLRQKRDRKGFPVFDNGKPVFQTPQDMGYDLNGKKIAPLSLPPARPAAAAVPAPQRPAVAPVAAAAQGEPAPVRLEKPPAAKEKDKHVYTGPTTVIELSPTPVLDQEGRQRLDPDGKPMFNPPVRQMRDKKGHPVFENDKPVFQTAKDMGYDENGKKIPVVKEKPPKTVIVNITHGTFTVDGLTGKAQLNYEIHDLKYIYFYVPWIGTTVVSNSPFPGSKEQKDGFQDKTLTVQVEDHTLQLYSDTRLLDKKGQPAYVLVDRDFKLPTSNPVVGYGATPRAPYEWPGARQDKFVTKGSVLPPPLPENMKPQMLLAPCPAGQMRKPGPRPLPGQTAMTQPCVPIAAAISAPAPPK